MPIKCCGMILQHRALKLRLQEDRDTELLYRSPNNFLCAAAPLTEAIPEDFLQVQF